MAIANTTIRIKKSVISGNVPSTLANGEIAINSADGKLYYSTPTGSLAYITNTNSFATINASSTLILATSQTDTLGFSGNNGVYVTGNSTSKSISIGLVAPGTSGNVLTSNGTTWISVSPVGGGAGATVTPTSTNATFYPVFNNSTSGSLTIADVNSNFTFNPSTGALAAPELQATNGLIVNSKTVSTSYTIPTGYNATATGPMTIASGAVVTIPSGSRWMIL